MPMMSGPPAGAGRPRSYMDRLNGEVDRGGGIGGGQDALNTSTAAAVSSAMPSFYQALQGIRESSVRRGISTGDLGTSYEGDLASAFQRNTENATASHASEMYQFGQNNYLDLLSGMQDRQTASDNARRQRRSGLGGALGGLVGGIGGFAVGGPAGAATGARIGGSIGAGIGGY